METNRTVKPYPAVHGIEPICGELAIAPSTYHTHAARRAHPSRASAEARYYAQLEAIALATYASDQTASGNPGQFSSAVAFWLGSSSLQPYPD